LTPSTILDFIETELFRPYYNSYPIDLIPSHLLDDTACYFSIIKLQTDDQAALLIQ
jgi:hypothetical protein